MSVNGSREAPSVMAPGTTAEHVGAVVHRLDEARIHARVSRGREATAIGAAAEPFDGSRQR